MLVLSTSTLQHWRRALHLLKCGPLEKRTALSKWLQLEHWQKKKNEVRESREPLQIGSEVFVPQRKAEVDVRQQQNHGFATISPYKQFKPWLLAILRPVSPTVTDEVFHSFITSQQTQVLPKLYLTDILLGWWGYEDKYVIGFTDDIIPT